MYGKTSLAVPMAELDMRSLGDLDETGETKRRNTSFWGDFGMSIEVSAFFGLLVEMSYQTIYLPDARPHVAVASLEGAPLESSSEAVNLPATWHGLGYKTVI